VRHAVFREGWQGIGSCKGGAHGSWPTGRYDDVDEREERRLERRRQRYEDAGTAYLQNIPQSMKKMNRIVRLVSRSYCVLAVRLLGGKVRRSVTLPPAMPPSPGPWAVVRRCRESVPVEPAQGGPLRLGGSQACAGGRRRQQGAGRRAPARWCVELLTESLQLYACEGSALSCRSSVTG
jgi:hypothetical protein